MIENIITQKELDVVLREINQQINYLFERQLALEKHLGLLPKQNEGRTQVQDNIVVPNKK